MEVAGRTPKRVSLHAAPINVAEGLKKYLFEKMHSVVMTSATLCAGGSKHGRDARVTVARVTVTPNCDTGVPPVPAAPETRELQVRQGAYLPHWTKTGS